MGFLGGEVGLDLLLRLAALSLLGAGAAFAVRRLPEIRQRRLADLFFFVVLALQLGMLLRLSLQPLQIDVDTERSAAALGEVSTLGEVVRLRGVWAADYILQGPVVHALRSFLPIDALGAHRLLAFAGAVATALLLRGGARRLGATPWGAALAGLLPLCTFGGAWITLTLDDNAFASALQWAFFFSLLRGLEADGDDARRLAWLAGVGVLLGLAVSVHRKALLWAALVPLAPLVSRDLRSPTALKGLALAGLAAGLTHGVAAVLFLPTGFGADTLSLLLSSAHHQHPAWWYPAGAGGPGAQAAAVWDGLHAALVTFPVLRERALQAGPLHFFDVFVALCIAGVLAAAWRTRHERSCRLLMLGVALQTGHSLLYEPHSVERWDMVVGGGGVLVAAALAGVRRESWRYAAAWLWLVLVATGHLTLRWHPAWGG